MNLTRQQKTAIMEAFKTASELRKTDDWAIRYAADQAGIKEDQVVEYLNSREEKKRK